MFYIFLTILFIYLIVPYKKISFNVIHIKKYIIPIIFIMIMMCLVIFSQDVFNSAYTGLMLWVNNIVPSLFPFLICLNVLTNTNILQIIGKLLEPVIRPFFNIPGNGAFAIIMGMCSGYPVGAKFAASLREKNQCSKTEGERILAFTNTSGPLFIIGAVGIGMFGDGKLGTLFLITHIISALLVGIIFRFYKFNHNTQIYKKELHSSSNQNTSSIKTKTPPLGNLIGEAIKNSISTLLLICGFIVFFEVLGTILDSIGVTNIISKTVCNILSTLGFSTELTNEISAGCFKGLLEITSGLKILSTATIDYKILFTIIAIILGFGGLSVHMQVASIISATDLSLKPYLLGKTLHGIFAGTLTYIVLTYTSFFNLEAVETFGSFATNKFNNDSYGYINSGNVLIIAISIIMLLVLAILLLKKDTYKYKKSKSL